jgi:excisionase family DNA binding protein
MTTDTSRTLSPAQAARRANVGRTTVMRALSAGELRAVRDNRNTWRILPDDVDAWSGQRPVIDRTMAEDTPGQPVVIPTDTPETLARLAVAETRLIDALEAVAEARRERDAWRQQAQDLARRPNLLDRLLGRARFQG